MYTIRKQFRFEAAHHLEGLAEGHPCMRLHGHSYKVEVMMRSAELDEHYFVRDYHDLDEFKAYLDSMFDHRDLNRVLALATTAENIAKHFYDWCKLRWPEVSAVSVAETEKTWATYSE